MNEWDDRWIDASLHELHGQKPPDLSSRVVSALERGPVDASPLVVTGGPRRRSPFLVVTALVASIAAMVAIGIALVIATRAAGAPSSPESTERVVARLPLAVQRGTIECVEAELGGSAVSRHPAGSVASFAARPGNRLRCDAAAEVRVGPFGVVESFANMELEVRSMEFTWKNGAIAASSLTVAVVAGVVTWHNLARSETAAAGETLRMHAPSEDGGVLAENAELRRKLEQLQRENDALKVQPTREPAASAALVAEPAKVEPEAPPTPQSAMTFTDERYAAALAGVDWKTMGAVTKEMGPMLAQLVEAMKKGEEIPPELGIKIQELNSKLVAQVPAMLKAGLPGFGPNGAYTHPLVVANVLANTLAAAGQPLDAAQQAKIDGLVRAFSAEAQSIAQGPREFEIEQLIADTEMKDRFYREVNSHLAPVQSEQMYPAGSTEYDGASLFNTGLMTRPYAESLAAKNPTEFARLASNRLGEDLGLDDAAAAKVRAIVERSVGASPELWNDKADAVELGLRMPKAGRTTAAMKRQLEMMREIQRTVPMTPEQLKKFRASKGILVPLPR